VRSLDYTELCIQSDETAPYRTFDEFGTAVEAQPGHNAGTVGLL